MESMKKTKDLQFSLARLVRAHLLYVLVFIGAIIVGDAWNVITTEIVLQRWTIAAVMAIVTAIVWYASRQKTNASSYYQLLVVMFIALDLFVAAYSVYVQRGIASKSVLLFVIPIIVSAVLASRAAVFAVSTIATAAYVLASVRYFYLNPGQAYKAELYGEVAYYIGLMYLVATLVWIILLRQRPTKL